MLVVCGTTGLENCSNKILACDIKSVRPMFRDPATTGFEQRGSPDALTKVELSQVGWRWGSLGVHLHPLLLVYSSSDRHDFDKYLSESVKDRVEVTTGRRGDHFFVPITRTASMVVKSC